MCAPPPVDPLFFDILPSDPPASVSQVRRVVDVPEVREVQVPVQRVVVARRQRQGGGTRVDRPTVEARTAAYASGAPQFSPTAPQNSAPLLPAYATSGIGGHLLRITRPLLFHAARDGMTKDALDLHRPPHGGSAETKLQRSNARSTRTPGYCTVDCPHFVIERSPRSGRGRSGRFASGSSGCDAWPRTPFPAPTATH